MPHAYRTRWKLLLLRLLIPAIIALLLSLVITLVNYGFTEVFLRNWAKGFVVAFMIIPLAIRLIPIVAQATRGVLGNRSAFTIRCVVAVLVAAMMEGLIALAVTLVQQGMLPGWTTLWGTVFLKALPVGLMIGFTMTFIVQPRLQRLAVLG